MPLLDHLPSLSREALLALVAAQQRQLAEQERQIAELTAGGDAVPAESERLTRGTKRQAAPFANGTRGINPKRPGRKPGAGPLGSRALPLPDQITEPPVEGPVLLDACPAWGGRREEGRVDFASTTAIPALPRPKVTQYRVAVCRGAVGGPPGRGQHPDVAPDQYGATAHRVGERAMAAAQGLHYGIGLPVRQVPRGWEALRGSTLPQGAIPQDALRRARGAVGEVYESLRAAVPASPLVHTDDTGWRIGGAPASLRAFDTEAATVSQVGSPHRHEEVQEVSPADYEGVMGTDRGRRYDAKAGDEVKQQKCRAHIGRAISEVLATKKGRARDVGERLKALPQDAMALWRAYHAGEVADDEAHASPLWDALTPHLRPRVRMAPDTQRLLNGIGGHHDRGHLLRCLEAPRIEPTTTRSERARRPAVIARQVAQCAQNEAGAQAFAAFTRVGRTLAKQGGHSMGEGLYQLFRSARVPTAPP
jgi:hypothetical protein